MSDDDDDKENPQLKSKNPATYIHETVDSIVDLADPDTFGKITSEREFFFIRRTFITVFTFQHRNRLNLIKRVIKLRARNLIEDLKQHPMVALSLKILRIMQQIVTMKT